WFLDRGRPARSCEERPRWPRSTEEPLVLDRLPRLWTSLMNIASADVARIRDLYGQGRYLLAYEAASAFGPVRQWAGTPARLIGGRLAIQLGAPKLGRQLHAVAFRSTPAFPEAIYYHARFRMERFGPLACWQFMRRHPDWSDAPPEL